MYLNTLDVKLSPRTQVNSYNLEINRSTLEILKLILEFKLVSACHVARFLIGQEKSRYLYRKLRRMWQAQLLESFRVFYGGMANSTLFYMLSKPGIKLLLENGLCEPSQLKTYPKAKALLSWGLFKHEAEIVELASLESLNKSKELDINFLGENNSKSQDFRDDISIEALTPDYTAIYKVADKEYRVYTEFERTRKSSEALLNKIQRYLNFLSPDELQKFTLRLMFQTRAMERNFWLNILTGRPSLLKLGIVTTNLELISGHKDFLEPVYATERTVKLSRARHLMTDTSQRIKLFNFL